MQSLTPFIEHEAALGAAGEQPQPAGAPLGMPPPLLGQMEPAGPPDTPEVQLPPPQMPTQQRAPAANDAAVPMTDGTPLPCRQKNAAEYLRGRSPGVMEQYGQGLFGAQQRTDSPHPAPSRAEQDVLSLVEWREEAPYG